MDTTPTDSSEPQPDIGDDDTFPYPEDGGRSSFDSDGGGHDGKDGGPIQDDATDDEVQGCDTQLPDGDEDRPSPSEPTFWLRADRVETETSAGGREQVTRWCDLSTEERNVEQTPSPSKDGGEPPTLVNVGQGSDSVPAVSFDGMNDMMNMEPTASNAFTAYFVIQRRSESGRDLLLSVCGLMGVQNLQIRLQEGDTVSTDGLFLSWTEKGQLPESEIVEFDPLHETWMVLEVRVTGSDAKVWYAYEGSGSINTSGPKTKSNPAAGGTWKFNKLGGNSCSGFDWFDGEMAEVIFFQKALDGEEDGAARNVRNYLQRRYLEGR